MMTALLLVLWSSSVRSVQSFTTKRIVNKAARLQHDHRFVSSRVFSSTATCTGISRISTLQQLICEFGVPALKGSEELRQIAWEPAPTTASSFQSPELIDALQPSSPIPFPKLHPYVVPIVHCPDQHHFIGAYHNPAVELELQKSSSSSTKPPQWPLVYTTLQAPGMQLLAMESEHFMHRIVAECDAQGHEQVAQALELYQNGAPSAEEGPASHPTPYTLGAVEQLGYGVEKYCLLKAGPFPDLYQHLASYGHKDESSALIAAETANAKCAGFGSNFLFYAQLLSRYENRSEECRDAARMCLRLPLATVGLSHHPDFQSVAVLGQLATETDSIATCLTQLRDFYDKLREAEHNSNSATPPGDVDAKTPAQMAVEEAGVLLDHASLQVDGPHWNQVRPAVAELLRQAGLGETADFVFHTSTHSVFE